MKGGSEVGLTSFLNHLEKENSVHTRCHLVSGALQDSLND